MEGAAYIIGAAFVLDLLLGDPQGWPHPVRWMGRAIEHFEPKFRQLVPQTGRAGALFALSLILGTFSIGWLVIALAGCLHPAAGIALEVILLFYCISVRSLEKAAMGVFRALRQDGLQGGRAAVAMIVGRETAELDEPGVARATVETVAENLVDGVLSPLFFAMLGGVPLALAFKMINTLDSMVGYKNETYREFGRTAARIDDAANYIPARLSVLIIALASQMTTKRGWPALLIGFRDGRKHTSPNAGFSEATFAGALEVRLGGPGTYHGERVEKPHLGEEYRAVIADDIPRACRLMVITSLLWLAVIQIIAIAMEFYV